MVIIPQRSLNLVTHEVLRDRARGSSVSCTPVTWCAARLPSNIRTVSPEELIWRIRMKHDAEQTQKLITAWPR
jgi:hypothetical protein